MYILTRALKYFRKVYEGTIYGSGKMLQKIKRGMHHTDS